MVLKLYSKFKKILINIGIHSFREKSTEFAMMTANMALVAATGLAMVALAQVCQQHVDDQILSAVARASQGQACQQHRDKHVGLEQEDTL